MAISKKTAAIKGAQTGAAKPSEAAARKSQASEIHIPLRQIRFDHDQPRTDYKTLDGRMPKESEEHIIELANTIKARGLIDAITVRPDPENKDSYIVVVGESRTRAYLHLGLKEIRAVVHKDLNNPMQRLLFQLSENVNRKPLSVYDLAKAVVKLHGGDKESRIVGLSQSEIAVKLGKSEGWVTRHLRYANEEHYRVWVKTGLVDSVEALYITTILHKATQLDLLRRVELPESDPAHLSKPLPRKLIDDLYAKQSREKKEAKAERNNSQLPAMADFQDTNRAQLQAAGTLEKPAVYSLSEEDRKKVLASNFSEKYQSNEVGGKRAPAIHCRGTLQNTMSLFQFFEENKTLQSAMLNVVVDLIIPGELAKDLAAKLSGALVDDSDVPMSLQNSLSAFNKS
jgi:ParB/RepB/Spo0J family partition protein